MNILILTSIYPQPDDDKSAGITPVVHYFAKEWAKDNNVMVFHNANKYPSFCYMLPNSLIQKINSKLGMVVPKLCQRKELITNQDGVEVVRYPMLKVIPKRAFNDRQIKKQYKKIVEYIEGKNFIPDVIIGHWENPQIPLLSMLKKKYECKTALVFHDLTYMNQKNMSKWNKYFYDIDVIGCRSKSSAEDIKKEFKLQKEPFVCYSGIPKQYLREESKISFGNTYQGKIKKHIFVGRLIERKNVDTIIESLHNSYKDKDFELNIVGIGACEKDLRDLTEKLDICSQVNFLGRVSRDKVSQLMLEAQCFTMISENEVFGLVYLEAMANGCIVIASKGGGIDGIIKDGENGFLCEAGNVKELEEIYNKINNMSAEEISRICNAAIKTAYGFTDEKVADRYLMNIL